MIGNQQPPKWDRKFIMNQFRTSRWNCPNFSERGASNFPCTLGGGGGASE